MPAAAATRETIAAALAAFAAQPLPVAATGFFALLGYGSKRQMRFPSRTAFLAQFADGKADFAKRHPALAAAGAAPVFVQQLTGEEIGGNSSSQLELLASDATDLRRIDSYLFLAFPLPSAAYTQTELSALARALNSLFAQPVLVLFHHGHHLSLAITYRRRSKTDSSRDVADRKVTFIRGIAIAHPHPGHLSILEDFSLPAVARARQRDIRTFTDLDDAWRDSISTELLTKRFYREVANWYFWAREHARFPKDAPLDAEGKPALPLIRLLTRLLFCWFLREKTNPRTGETLLPDELFDQPRIREILRDATPTAGTYYLAILQNLFFATLNTRMDPATGSATRRFVEETDKHESDDHMVHHFWRHAKLLRDQPAFERLFRRIPFLNGGLFECLDERRKRGRSTFTTEIRNDGFSELPRNQPHLPNFLFFGPTQDDIDLSAAYGDSSRSHETVRPLLEIFRHYKFTLTENTPLDEEVALDPDLLGHVFENLLAAFNPETGTIARKATGSFYTPDIAVDWMVEQALLVYLEERLLTANQDTPKVAERLRDLLAWKEEAGHRFAPAEVETLIDALHTLRALDPACGSGAFPMGLLQKLVMVLRKLDPGNERWRARNLADAEAISSPAAREAALVAIKRAFAHDNDDYGRKLYLIERCLFGVDIQPIATQIAKLRFFLSLLVDQAIDPTEENYGILPLPNLETKIVAANTLLDLQRGQLDLDMHGTQERQDKLERVRHEYFTARSYAQKKELKARDAALREELADALADSGECSAADARRLADWNPYDQNASAPFFDPGWMFGLSRQRGFTGFDLMIGNPPYVRQEELKAMLVTDSLGRERPLKEALKENYACFGAQADLYVYFFERSFRLLRTGGVLSFICSNKYFRSGYGERLRTFFLYTTRPRVLLDFGDAPVFTAIAYPSILVAQKTRQLERVKELDELTKQPGNLPPLEWQARVLNWSPSVRISEFPEIFEEQSFVLAQRDLRPDGWQIEAGTHIRLMDRLLALPDLRSHCGGRVCRGIITGLNEAFFIDRETRDRLIAEHESSAELIKPLLRGRDIKRWRVEPQNLYAIIFPFGFHTELPRFPAILEHLTKFKKELKARGQCTSSRGGGNEGQHHWLELDNNPKPGFLAEFAQPKIIVPAITGTVNYAPDFDGYYCNNKATIFIPPSVPYALAVANSQVSWWFARQRFATKQGGFYDFEPRYSSTTPIPPATPEQTQLVERLSEYLIWLHSPDAPSATATPQAGLMGAYFEQWLNGLVYELFFPEELHVRQLHLFDETARLAPPALAELAKKDHLPRLQELFAKAYATDAPLRAQLFTLPSLEVVRLIEGDSGETTSATPTATSDE
jgi:adenine-specific DNA-methyltransferase